MTEKKMTEKKTLAEMYPDLAAEWHPTKNGDLTPEDVTPGSDKVVWWTVTYDDSKTGKQYCFEWKASVFHRTAGTGCPYLSGKKVLVGFNDLASNYPDIAAEWHPTKNGDLTPEDVTYGSGKVVWWQIEHETAEGKIIKMEWADSIIHRVEGRGCPFLAGKKVLV